ncbi:MAG: hypothetical protein C4523_06670 [Myxococcales bacterium]|nr:MAG: hypothetical protein C4523_06670 [Myxococcales bacterium]
MAQRIKDEEEMKIQNDIKPVEQPTRPARPETPSAPPPETPPPEEDYRVDLRTSGAAPADKAAQAEAESVSLRDEEAASQLSFDLARQILSDSHHAQAAHTRFHAETVAGLFDT